MLETVSLNLLLLLQSYFMAFLEDTAPLLDCKLKCLCSGPGPHITGTPCSPCRVSLGIVADTKWGRIFINMTNEIYSFSLLYHIPLYERGITQLYLTLYRPHGLYYSWSSPGKNTGVGSHSPSPEDRPNPGMEPRFPALQADSSPVKPPGKPFHFMCIYIVLSFFLLLLMNV